jgi:ribosomal protein S18 acetylase RimI-like enzyme
MSTLEEVKLRPAANGDCQNLAELVSLASGGVVDYLFHGLIPGLSPVDVVVHGLRDHGSQHSYTNAVVAEINGTVAGMALSYPSSMHGITDEMRRFIPSDRLERLSEFFSAKVEDSWYVDAIGVFDGHRRKGIGIKLMKAAEETGRENGFECLSLICFADNSSALAMYRSLGYGVVRSVSLEGNEFIPHEGGCLLLRLSPA